MSDPNGKTKQTQTLILGGVVVSIFGLVTVILAAEISILDVEKI